MVARMKNGRRLCAASSMRRMGTCCGCVGAISVRSSCLRGSGGRGTITGWGARDQTRGRVFRGRQEIHASTGSGLLRFLREREGLAAFQPQRRECGVGDPTSSARPFMLRKGWAWRCLPLMQAKSVVPSIGTKQSRTHCATMWRWWRQTAGANFGARASFRLLVCSGSGGTSAARSVSQRRSCRTVASDSVPPVLRSSPTRASRRCFQCRRRWPVTSGSLADGPRSPSCQIAYRAGSPTSKRLRGQGGGWLSQTVGHQVLEGLSWTTLLLRGVEGWRRQQAREGKAVDRRSEAISGRGREPLLHRCRSPEQEAGHQRALSWSSVGRMYHMLH